MAVADLIKAVKSTNAAGSEVVVALAEYQRGDTFLLRGDPATNVPGSIALTDPTDTYITQLASGSTSANITFELPDDTGTSGQMMITDGTGKLSFTSNITFDTLAVTNQSYFNSDSNYEANIIPTTDNAYNIGGPANRWANIYADTFIGTDATFNNITISTTSPQHIDTTAGDLILNSATGQTNITTDVDVSGDLHVYQDLIVDGVTTTINSTTVTVDDPVFTLGGDTPPATDDNKDRGIEFRYHDGTAARIGFFGWDDSASAFTFFDNATNSSEVFTGTPASVIFGPVQATTGNFSSTLDVIGLTTLANTNNTGTLTVTGTTTTNGTFDANGTVNLNASDINIGNATSDVVSFTAQVDSNFIPNGDFTYNLGEPSNRWNIIYADVIETDSNTIGNIQIGVTGPNEIDTAAGDLTLDSASGNVVVDDNLQITGLTPTRVVYVGASKELVDSANMTFTGTVLNVTEVQVDNININADTITSSATNLNLVNNVVISGNLTVNGTTTTVNSTTMTVDDPVITVGGDTAPATDDNKDRGVEFRYNSGGAKIGFFGWDDSVQGFTCFDNATNSSEVFSGTRSNLYTGGINATTGNFSSTLGVTGLSTLQSLSVPGTSTLTNTTNTGTLTVTGTTTTNGALTANGQINLNGLTKVNGNIDIGNATSDTISFTARVDTTILPVSDLTYNLGSSTLKWNTVYADVHVGTATRTFYADLAENYEADKMYKPGTVVIFGGKRELTTTKKKNDKRVAGVISTNPAHIMNMALVKTGTTVVELALQGRVPCNVIGKVKAGDIIVTSETQGYGMVNNKAKAGTIIGKAISSKNNKKPGIVEVLVGRT